MNARFFKWLKVIAAVCAAVVLAFCANVIFINVSCFQERVKVRIRNLPVGTTFACVVSEEDGAPQIMEWRVGSILGTSKMHPAKCTWSFQNPENPKVDWDAYVDWRTSDRYGVVTQDQTGAWRVT